MKPTLCAMIALSLATLILTEQTSAVPTLGDPGFENPAFPANSWEQQNGVGNANISPSSGAWTFSPTAGITHNLSAFQNAGVPAPEGVQHALIQNVGSVSQTGSGFVAGDVYSLTLSVNQRQPGQFNDLVVTVDGQQVMGGRVNMTAFTDVTTANFVAQSATPTVVISTTNPIGGDRTTFFDDVRINTVVPTGEPILSNPSFEGPSGPQFQFPDYRLIDGWSSDSLSTGTNGAGQPFLNGLPIPDGGRIGFIQRDPGGVRTITQTITGLTPGQSYTLEYWENERGHGGGGTPVARPSATLDGNTLVAEHDTVRGDWRRVRGTFTATGTSATLSLSNNTGAGDNTALFDALSILAPAPVIPDGGFENPVQPPNNWKQANGIGGGDLTGSAWTITNGAGITRNISPFQNGGIPAPEGAQHGLLQATGGFEQTLTGFVPNTAYELSLFTMARQGQNFGNDLEIVLDAGLPTELFLVDIPEVTFNAFTEITSPSFIAFKDSYTLTIRSTLDGGNLTGDRTTFIDDLRFDNLGVIPEPATATLALLGAAAVLGRRRRRA